MPPETEGLGGAVDGVVEGSGAPRPSLPTRRLGRSRWLAVAAVAAGVALLASVFATGLGRDPRVIRSPLLGEPAPGFTLPRIDATGTISLSALRGQVVVINFWASWCGPCRQEHDHLQAAWNRYRDAGVVVLGISYQDKVTKAMAFRDELGGDWPLVDDATSRIALAYGVTGVPETFFIDRRGRVAYKHYGAVTYDVLSEWITRLR